MIYYPSRISLMIYKKKNLELIHFNALPVNKMKTFSTQFCLYYHLNNDN